MASGPNPGPHLHVARPLRMTPTELFYYVVGVGKSKEYVVTHENDVTFKLPPLETQLCWARPPPVPAPLSLLLRQSRVIAPSLKPVLPDP